MCHSAATTENKVSVRAAFAFNRYRQMFSHTCWLPSSHQSCLSVFNLKMCLRWGFRSVGRRRRRQPETLPYLNVSTHHGQTVLSCRRHMLYFVSDQALMSGQWRQSWQPRGCRSTQEETRRQTKLRAFYCLRQQNLDILSGRWLEFLTWVFCFLFYLLTKVSILWQNLLFSWLTHIFYSIDRQNKAQWPMRGSMWPS